MKYQKLTEYLSSIEQEQVTLSFAEIEQIIGFELCASTHKHREWWSNGGHSHARAWMNAGYKVEKVDLENEKVLFRRKNTAAKACTGSDLTVCGYTFHFLQELIPEMDGDLVREYYPEIKPGRQLNRNGEPPFCSFSVRAEHVPGVYLWIVDDEVVYIGETEDLSRRFNSGYGHIYAANCYTTGRSTNCKMNKVVLGLARQGRFVKLYFCQTDEYKRAELELLSQINTRYNVKDN